MQSLALEFLRYAKGVDTQAREERKEEYRRKLLETIVKGSLAASGGYEEKVLFSEYFRTDEDEVYGESGGDANTDFDYSGVDFGVPDESEMEILARMLADNSVTISGAPLEGPEAVQVEAEESSLPAPREFDFTTVEQDTEWV